VLFCTCGPWFRDSSRRLPNFTGLQIMDKIILATDARTKWRLSCFPLQQPRLRDPAPPALQAKIATGRPYDIGPPKYDDEFPGPKTRFRPNPMWRGADKGIPALAIPNATRQLGERGPPPNAGQSMSLRMHPGRKPRSKLLDPDGSVQSSQKKTGNVATVHGGSCAKLLRRFE